MKKLIMLFLLVSFMCFGEDKVETQKSYKIIQREEMDFLKTQLIKSNNKIDDLSKKIEELEDKGIEKLAYKDDEGLGLVYNVDQIYQNSMQYYDKTIEFLKWLVGGMLLVLGYLKWDGNKKYEKERKEITKELDKRVERMLRENKDIKENIAKQEGDIKRKTLELDKKIEQTTKEMNEKLKEVEYNAELVRVIGVSDSKEKIEELKKLSEKYPQKFQIYFELGRCLISEKNNEKIIEIINKLKGLKIEETDRYLSIGCLYELLGNSIDEENNSIDEKIYFKEAIDNYKKANKINLNPENSIAFQNGIERVEEKLKELEGKE